MAIDLGSSNTTRYLSVADHADFTLPNSDWCWVAVLKLTGDTSGYVLSTGTYNASNTCTWYRTGNFIAMNVNGTERSVNISGIMTSGNWCLLYGRRKSSLLNVGGIDLFSSSITQSTTISLAAASDGGQLNIGARADQDTAWFFQGVFGYVALIKDTVEDAQIIEMANGRSPLHMSFAPNVTELWHMQNASDVVPMIAGHSLTLNGSSYAAADDIFVPYLAKVIPIKGEAASGITLVLSDLSQSQSVDNVALTQANTLSINDSSQSQSVDNVALTQANTLAVDQLDQSQTVDNVSLTQSNVLAIDALDQSQTVDNVVLVQANVLALNDLDQSQTVDNVVLSTGVTLALQELGQSQGVDNIDLVQANVLAINDIDQSQTVDNITLSTGVLLVVAALSQSQSVDNVALVQSNTLSVNELSQSQSLESVLLTQANVLSVDALSQSQVVDNITLSLSVVLSPGDLSQTQVVDGVALTQANILAIQDLMQSQGLDNTVLVQGSVLAVADLTQSQTLDNISFVVIATPSNRIYLIEAENRNYLVN